MSKRQEAAVVPSRTQDRDIKSFSSNSSHYSIPRKKISSAVIDKPHGPCQRRVISPLPTLAIQPIPHRTNYNKMCDIRRDIFICRDCGRTKTHFTPIGTPCPSYGEGHVGMIVETRNVSYLCGRCTARRERERPTRRR